MKIFTYVAAIAALALAGTLAMPDDAIAKKKKAAKCVVTTAEGSALTSATATTNAKSALAAAFKKDGLKGRGVAKTDCSSSLLVMTTCRASQTACK